MHKFKDKSPGMQGVLDKMAKGVFGRTITESLEQHVCVACGQDTKQLEGSDAEEYELSALCPHLLQAVRVLT